MILCSLNDVSQNYGGTNILKQIQLEIKTEERIGLVGRNGSGKTTLIKLMANVEEPTEGSIHWKKGITIGYLQQMFDLKFEVSVKEMLKNAFADVLAKEKRMRIIEKKMVQQEYAEQLNTLLEEYGKLQEEFLREGGYEVESRIQQVANGLKIADLLDKNSTILSGGEQTKVNLAFNLLKKPDLLLLDEPTNHLDLLAIEWLEDFLNLYKGTVVVISHDRHFLDKVVSKIVEIEDGQCTTYNTHYSDFLKVKEENLLREFQAYAEQQRKIKKMKERAKTLREWANQAKPPNPGLYKKAQHLERMIDWMEKVKKPHVVKKMGLDIQASKRSGTDVILAEDIAKLYDDKVLFESVSMHIRFKERVGIVGENGSGKSTLLKILIGQITPDVGHLKIGNSVNIGYLSQHIFENQKDQRLIDVFREEVSVTEEEARSILARFLFYGLDVFQKIKELSGGERMRLGLAQLMYQNINLLIMDEPTNHLDIESREVLEETLSTFEGTMLAVSHDRYFLDHLCEKIYWIEDNNVDYYAGNYSWSRNKRNLRFD